MLILICGSRHYTDAKKIARVLAEYGEAEPAVLHGGNGKRDPSGKIIAGADAIAGREALLLGYTVQAIQPDWKQHGKAAGPIRNRQMLDRNPTLVIAFGRGRGTSDCIEEARRRGIPVRQED